MSQVYFIRCKSTGLIKIGLSDNPWSRLSKIQSDNPGELEILAIEEGGAKHEYALHRRFADYHVRGEWHRPGSALLGYLESLPRPLNPNRRQCMTLDGTSLDDRKLARTLNMAISTCAQMRSGIRSVPLATAIRLHGITGDKIGPLLKATDEEIATLRKYVEAAPFFSDVTRASRAASAKSEAA